MSTQKVVTYDTFEFQKPVETFTLSSPPVSPIKGHRYIVLSAGSGDWSGQSNNIAIYNGSSWDFIIAREGMLLYIKDIDKYYKYITSWTEYIGQQGTTGTTGAQGTTGITGTTGASYPNDGTVNPTNLATNGNFEMWSGGVSVAPDGWILTGAGATVTRESSIVKIGSYSAKVTRNGANGAIYTYINTSSGYGLNYWKGRTITFGVWVYSTTPNTTLLAVTDGIGESDSAYHPGDGTWRFLTVTRTIDTGAISYVLLVLDVINSDTTSYFDGVMVVEGSSSFAFSPKPAEEGVWSDYSSSSTITGFSSISAAAIYTKKIGKVVFVFVEISGTSNTTTLTFTLPYNSVSLPPLPSYVNIACQDAGVSQLYPGLLSLAYNSNLVSCYKTLTATGFTATGTKTIIGQFWYITT